MKIYYRYHKTFSRSFSLDLHNLQQYNNASKLAFHEAFVGSILMILVSKNDKIYEVSTNCGFWHHMTAQGGVSKTLMSS